MGGTTPTPRSPIPAMTCCRPLPERVPTRAMGVLCSHMGGTVPHTWLICWPSGLSASLSQITLTPAAHFSNTPLVVTRSPPLDHSPHNIHINPLYLPTRFPGRETRRAHSLTDGLSLTGRPSAHPLQLQPASLPTNQPILYGNWGIPTTFAKFSYYSN